MRRRKISRSEKVGMGGEKLEQDIFVRLSKEKRHIKQLLKDYDLRFKKRYGRPPLKFEKEPIRELYEAYNTIKIQLSSKSPNEVRPGVPTGSETSTVRTGVAFANCS